MDAYANICGMAFIIFADGRSMTVSPKVGEMIWRVKDGLEKPRDQNQARFVARIRRIYLNKYAAPQVYLEAHRTDNTPQPLQYRLPYKDN